MLGRADFSRGGGVMSVKESPTVKEIVVAYCEASSFHSLYNAELGCACSAEDMCDHSESECINCRPAGLIECAECPHKDGEGCASEFGPGGTSCAVINRHERTETVIAPASFSRWKWENIQCPLNDTCPMDPETNCPCKESEKL